MPDARAALDSAAGLWLIAGAAVSTTFAGPEAGMVLLGTGAGLALPTATGSVVGSVPPTDSGVASAADTTAIQLGGALGVAVVGSLLATRYQDRMTGALSGRPLPATVKNSLGGALAAARAGGTTGPPLVHLAKTAFISGMDLGLLTGAVVAVAGCLVALICLPTRSGQKNQLIRTGRGFPVRLRLSTPGRRRRVGSPPGQHQRADLEAEHHEEHRGAVISPARLDTKKQCSTEPRPGNGGDAGEPAADEGDWRADEPWWRTPQEISKFLRHRFALPNVWLPHALGPAAASAGR